MIVSLNIHMGIKNTIFNFNETKYGFEKKSVGNKSMMK